MTLYHGTNCTFKKPLIHKCLAYKDFGRGFYLTENPKMAKDWGRKKNPIDYHVNFYEVEDDFEAQIEREGLSVKRFSADAEWAEFVYHNREEEHYVHEYDVVIGPVADNKIEEHFAKIRRNEATFEDIAPLLPYSAFRAVQICLCTEASFKLLKYIKRNAYKKQI